MRVPLFGKALGLGALTATLLCLALPLGAHAAEPSPTTGYRDADHEALDVSARVPEYGGAYHRGTTLMVWLTEVTDARLREAVKGIARMQDGPKTWTRVKGIKARYTWIQLVRWHDLAGGVFDVEGVVTSDIDDSRNRISFGVLNLDVEPAVRREIQEAGIPQAAVTVHRTHPIQLQPLISPRATWQKPPAWAAAGLVALVGMSVRRRWRGARSFKPDASV